MKKFLVLYCAPNEVMAEWGKTSPEDQKKSMEEWKAWGEKHNNDLIDFGNPVGKNKRVTAEGATDIGNEVGGFSIVQANSSEEAAKVFDDSPHFSTPGTYIEIMEMVQM